MRNFIEEDEDDLHLGRKGVPGQAPPAAAKTPSAFAKLRDEIAALKLADDETEVAPAEPMDYPAARSTKSKPTDDEELTKAQAKSRKATQRANLGRAGSEFAAAWGGYKADDSFWDGIERQGQAAVSNLKERRASAAAQEAKAKADADRDPASKRNKAYRESLRGAFPDYFKSLPAEIFEQLTTADKDLIFDPLKLKMTLDERRAETEAKAATKKATDEDRRLSSSQDEAALGDLVKRQFPDQDAKFVDGLSLTGKKALLVDLQKQRAEGAAGYRQEDAQSFAANLDEKRTERAKEEGDRERTVPGRGLALDAGAAREVRKIDAASEAMASAIGTLKELHSKYKGKALSEVADVDGSIAAAVENAQAAYREFKNLGVPSGKDAELSEAAVNNPAKFRNMILGRGPSSWDVLVTAAKREADAKSRSYMAPSAPAKATGGTKGHGKVTKETKSFRQYEDGHIERKQ